MATVDRVKSIFRLYATSPIWLLRINFPDPTEVWLCSDEKHDPLRESRSADVVTTSKEHGDGYSYRVPLGNPVVELSMDDLEDKMQTNVGKATEALSFAAHFDQLNITYRRSGIRTSYWFLDIVPNDASSLQKMGGGIAPAEELQALDLLRAAAISLALSYSKASNRSAILKLAPVFGLFDADQIPDWVQSSLPAEVKAAIKPQTESFTL